MSQFAQPKKHHGQQCVRNNVSSFTRAFTGVLEPRNGEKPTCNVQMKTMFDSGELGRAEIFTSVSFSADEDERINANANNSVLAKNSRMS